MAGKKIRLKGLCIMSNITGFFLSMQDRWLATWPAGQTQLIQRSTCYLYGTKAFHENKPLSCSSTLCIWSFDRQVSQQGWPSGHVYKGDTDIFHIAKTCTQYFHVSKPAHPLSHFLDLSTYILKIPASQTHTRTHHTISLPNPPPSPS